MTAEAGNNAQALDLLSRPVREGNVFEETLARILQLIRLGVVAPGEALPPERDLAQRLEVSRDTVREAIRALVEARVVESRRGRYGGTFVLDGAVSSLEPVTLGAAELADVFVMREVLELGAVRAAAATSLTAKQREELASRLADVKRADLGDYRRLDSRLHLSFAELSGSAQLVALTAENRMTINAMLDRIPLLAPNIAHSNEQHERIVWAVLSGDVLGAEAAMSEHISGTESLLRGFLG